MLILSIAVSVVLALISYVLRHHPHVCYTFYIIDFTTPILTLGRHFGLPFLGCIPKSWIHDLKKNEVLLYL